MSLPVPPRPRRLGSRWLIGPLLILVTLAAAWTWWAEAHPSAEREVRTWLHDQLRAWFPAAMNPDDGWHGLHRRAPGSGEGDRPPGAALSLVLIHGLDEPGDIWDDLAPALTAEGYVVWEYRYPNDQGIDRSTDWLAELWPTLPPSPPVVLIGHSMGGLVARDFVSRWRHPVGSVQSAPPAPTAPEAPAVPKAPGAPPASASSAATALPAAPGPPAASGISGPSVVGVILVGTPNAGSEWARLRVWLEVRDYLASPAQRPRDLAAVLRDGLGEAKIDLRPDSDFLRDLNHRPWPAAVPVFIIAGRLANLVDEQMTALKAAVIAAGAADLAPHLEHWDTAAGDTLGDGLVSLDSARLPGIEPLVVEASHRGLIRRLFADNPEPPAIAPILAVLRQWAP